MKKILLLIVYIYMYVPAKSQVLVDTNKVWDVVDCLNHGDCYTYSYQFSGDTLIGGYHYKFISSYFPCVMREDSSKKIFYYNFNLGAEYLMYDFSLAQGDTFNTVLPCNFPLTMVVDSVDSVTLINGERRKHYFFNWASDEWIEGVGSSSGPGFVGFYQCVFDVTEILLCFSEDGMLKYHNNNYDSTCNYTAVGITEPKKNISTTISPNPFHNKATLTITSELRTKNCELKIYDVMGRCVSKVSLSFGEGRGEAYINRENLVDGIYFYHLTNGDGQIAYGKFIVE